MLSTSIVCIFVIYKGKTMQLILLFLFVMLYVCDICFYSSLFYLDSLSSLNFLGVLENGNDDHPLEIGKKLASNVII